MKRIIKKLCLGKHKCIVVCVSVCECHHTGVHSKKNKKNMNLSLVLLHCCFCFMKVDIFQEAIKQCLIF